MVFSRNRRRFDYNYSRTTYTTNIVNSSRRETSKPETKSAPAAHKIERKTIFKNVFKKERSDGRIQEGRHGGQPEMFSVQVFSNKKKKNKNEEL